MPLENIPHDKEIPPILSVKNVREHEGRLLSRLVHNFTGTRYHHCKMRAGDREVA